MKKACFVAVLIAALVMVIGATACGKAENASTSEASSAASEVASTSGSATVSDEVSESASASSSTGEVSSSASAGTVADGAAYGYAGDDPVEIAVYKYMAEEASKNFEKADVSIPTVNIVHVDYTNPDEVLVYGDFWVENYNIKGDTLECESGGNFPGVMHLSKDGDGYVVSSFDAVADGASFDSSAKELFGENFDAFMKVYSDSDARDELRKVTVSDYVKLNGLEVAQYKDYGHDPVKLYQ